MDKKVVFFDFDNTLVDSLKYWYKILNKDMFIEFNKKIDKYFPQKRKGLSNLEIAQVFVDVTGVDCTADEINQEVSRRMAKYYQNNIKMLSGAKEFLVKLKKEGKVLALVTATDLALIEIALVHFQIKDLFDWIFTEDVIQKRKRDTEFLKKCLRKAKCKAEDVLFIEDSVGSLKCALELGIESIGVEHKYNKQKISKLGIPLIKNYKHIEKLLNRKG